MFTSTIIPNIMKIMTGKKGINALGFTLIELVVAIAIIGIISSLLTVNFIGARQRTRDAQRKSDLKQIQASLEMARADLGRYLLAAEYGVGCGSAIISGTATYMQKKPCDPLSTSTAYAYAPVPAAAPTTYTLFACLENGNDRDTDLLQTPALPNNAACTALGRYSMTVQNP